MSHFKARPSKHLIYKSHMRWSLFNFLNLGYAFCANTNLYRLHGCILMSVKTWQQAVFNFTVISFLSLWNILLPVSFITTGILISVYLIRTVTLNDPQLCSIPTVWTTLYFWNTVVIYSSVLISFPVPFFIYYHFLFTCE